MGKRSRRWRKKQRNKGMPPPNTSLTPEELYRNQDYETAANLLRSQIEKEPTDQRRTLLAECLYKLKQYQEAVAIIESIESKESFHFRLAGLCYYLREDYANAISYLDKALQLYEHPYNYYLLALAHAKSQKDYELEASTKSLITDLLSKALNLPECPIDAFLWFESLQGYEDADLEVRASILEKALTLYSDSEETRIRLARWYTYRLRQPKKALEILQPPIIKNTSNPQVWMRAFSAAKEDEDLESALKYLEGVQPTYESSRINLSLIKADTLLALERFQEAASFYDEAVNSEFIDTKILGLYGRAWIKIMLGNDIEALKDTEVATNLVLNGDFYLSSHVPLDIEDTMYGYDFIEHIEKVSSYYIKKVEDGLNINPELLGGLYYLLYEIELEHSEESEEAVEHLLLKANQLCEHPKIGGGLSGYFAKQKKWSLAVTHYLKYSLWAYEQNHSVFIDTSFLDKAEGDDTRIPKTERTKINKIASKYLKEYSNDNKAIRMIFEPFYRNFWRSLLLKDELAGDIVEVTKTLLESGYGDASVLWDYAFNLYKTGRIDEAEKAYKEYLELNPNSASALHNLSIILERKDLFQEAVELSKRALSLAPDDELISQRNEDLKSKAKKLQNQKQKADKQRKKEPQQNGQTGESTSQKGLSKKLRFEVFKRDFFTCQYCGRKAPDVVLEIDHIEPVSKGGTNDILNLITSCKDCNSGKSDRRLSDNTVLEKRRKQLEELQERKEQIEMMFQWQRELQDLDEQTIEQLSELWSELVSPFSLNENGKATLKKLLRRFELNEVMEAMRTAVGQYIEYDGDTPTHESVEKAWKKIGGICQVKKIEQEKPYMRELFYIRGILRNRLSYTNDWKIMKMLEQCVLLGENTESLKSIALEARNWTQWREMMETLLNDLQSQSQENLS